MGEIFRGKDIISRYPCIEDNVISAEIKRKIRIKEYTTGTKYSIKILTILVPNRSVRRMSCPSLSYRSTEGISVWNYISK